MTDFRPFYAVRRSISLPVMTLLAALGLSGCQSTRAPSSVAAPTGAIGGIPITIANPDSAETDPRFFQARADITVVSYSGQHGTQVSYHSPGGKVFLWYPGNSMVLQGDWKAAKPQQLCYRYASNTYNAYANQPGGKWTCRAASLMLFGLGIIHERKGDVFGLAKRSAPPFVSRKGREQLEEILAKLPPASPQDTPNRLMKAVNAARAEAIAQNDEKIWKQVGQPPAGQNTDANATNAE